MRCSVSSIRHPASGIQHPASGIQHPASGIQHPVYDGHFLSALLSRSTRPLQTDDPMSGSIRRTALKESIFIGTEPQTIGEKTDYAAAGI